MGKHSQESKTPQTSLSKSAPAFLEANSNNETCTLQNSVDYSSQEGPHRPNQCPKCLRLKQEEEMENMNPRMMFFMDTEDFGKFQKIR